jgi:cobalt-zinc-cadmium efflux system protein
MATDGHRRLGAEDDQCEVHCDAACHDPSPVAEAHHDHEHDGHGHGHGHGHGLGSGGWHARSGDRRRLGWSLGLTSVILVAEVIGGWLSGSLSLLSDAGHVFTDLTAQAISLGALALALRPADHRRTYGYHRAEILAALLNGLALFGLAGLIALSAWRRIGDPPHVHVGLMLPVAVSGLVANLVAASILARSETLNVRAAYLHILSDALASAAVVAGGLLMLWRPELRLIDPILALVIAVLIVINAGRLVRDALEILLEAAPRSIDLGKVREDVSRLDGVVAVHDLHVWTITSGLHALSAHIVVAEERSARESDLLLHQAKAMLLHRHHIAHSTLQIESERYQHLVGPPPRAR